jgi:hypothetical protein
MFDGFGAVEAGEDALIFFAAKVILTVQNDRGWSRWTSTCLGKIGSKC